MKGGADDDEDFEGPSELAEVEDEQMQDEFGLVVHRRARRLTLRRITKAISRCWLVCEESSASEWQIRFPYSVFACTLDFIGNELTLALITRLSDCGNISRHGPWHYLSLQA
jgi:hypothetical protein